MQQQELSGACVALPLSRTDLAELRRSTSLSLRQISAELASEGHTTPKGVPYSAMHSAEPAPSPEEPYLRRAIGSPDMEAENGQANAPLQSCYAYALRRRRLLSNDTLHHRGFSRCASLGEVIPGIPMSDVESDDILFAAQETPRGRGEEIPGGLRRRPYFR
jgi:hypothetical protein